MKKFVAILALLALSACSLLPSANQCNNVPFCEQVAKSTKGKKGLDARYTVQNMIQSPTLIGGKPVDPVDWPASVYAHSTKGACSATVIADRALLLAAHCMDDGSEITFSVGVNNYKASCEHNPQYAANPKADWALCFVDRQITGIIFEQIGVSEQLSLNDDLVLSGYGCTNEGGGGGNDGIFRVGKAPIKKLPQGTDYDTITKGTSALCYGDSGGAAYKEHADGMRFLVGVNSRGNIKDTSYFSSVFTGAFFEWASAWAKAHVDTRICGVHSDAQYCRTGADAPLPDSKFEISGGPACIKGLIGSDYLSDKDKMVEDIRAALEKYRR
jgi:hypothetical protein